MALKLRSLRVQKVCGVLVENIGSYREGVDLWQNEDEHYDTFDPQSMHDKMLEVVSISGPWHLWKLQNCPSKFPNYQTAPGLSLNSISAPPMANYQIVPANCQNSRFFPPMANYQTAPAN
ncbi:hypothetical protein VNO77_03080 [Canavalia gladiata]|uniref:Diacylglycerol kinase accessory domain-containing protein n=1 Tax=Canavalia gladiata TaxID=3824 RepID=A0AAN9R6H8_CANGL